MSALRVGTSVFPPEVLPRCELAPRPSHGCVAALSVRGCGGCCCEMGRAKAPRSCGAPSPRGWGRLLSRRAAARGLTPYCCCLRPWSITCVHPRVKGQGFFPEDLKSDRRTCECFTDLQWIFLLFNCSFAGLVIVYYWALELPLHLPFTIQNVSVCPSKLFLCFRLVEAHTGWNWN